ncbi:MAG: gliding motility-associated C-terminal domain-containing protein [Bacteroidales bacterium]|nr:gliding motility-associated C-terminal domain-containing protein [Bacteroidales bacterium]
MLNRFLIILLISLSAIAHGQENYLRCIEVINNTSTLITWVPPVEEAGFDHYEVFISEEMNQPFTSTETIEEYNETFYQHFDTPREGAPWYFYVVTHTNGGDSIISDTLQSIVLHLEAQNNKSVAYMEWNAPHIPLLPTSDDEYKVQRKFPWNEDWINVETTGQREFEENPQLCGDTVAYRIVMGDEAGCVSKSYVANNFFQDVVQPAAPQIDSISISPRGNTQIGWQPSSSKDTKAYEIFRLSGNTWSKLPGNPQGIDSTFYIDDSFKSCGQPVFYAIGAKDSCNNRTGNPYQFARKTMALSYSTNPCTDSVQLQWTGYVGMKPSLGGYRIFFSKNTGAYQEVGSTGNGDTTFTHIPQFESEDKLCYFIRAFSSDGTKTASTCRVCFTAHKPEQPDTLYVRKASVNRGGSIDLNYRPDLSSFVQGFIIQRSSSGNTYQAIETIGQVNNEFETFADASANPNQQAYYYRMITLDSCNKPADTSNRVRTIHLSGEALGRKANSLEWNNYEGFENGTEKYQLIRKEENKPASITDLQMGINSYEDDVSNLIGGTGIFTYRVRAISNETSCSTVDTAWSNQVTVQQAPGLFMPNAFSPNNDGKNDIFRPLFVFIPEGNYVFRIYNRWGELIFETRDKSRGWDGKHNGKPVEPGTYVYQVQYSGRQGNTHKKVGNVTLVR